MARYRSPRNLGPEVFRTGQHGHHQFGRHPGDEKAARKANRNKRHNGTKNKEQK